MLGAGLARSVDPAVTLDGVMGRARPMEGVYKVENPAKRRRRRAHPDQVDAPLRFASLEPIQEPFGAQDLDGLDWIIVGCETGKGAPPPDRRAVESVISACGRLGIPPFVKSNAGLDGPRRWPEDEGVTTGGGCSATHPHSR